MTPSDNRVVPLGTREIVVLGVAVGVGAAGLVMLEQPLAALGLLGIVTVGLALRFSDLCTLAFVFIVYSNAAVVAVKFHGVPAAMGNLVAALLILPLFMQLVVRRQPIIITPILPLILLFFGVQFAGALFSRYPDKSMANLKAAVLEGLVLYLLVTNLIRTPAMLRAVTWTLLAAGVLMAVFPLYQYATGTMDDIYGGFAQTTERGFRTGEETLAGDVLQKRYCGCIGEQNRFAQVMMLLIPLGLFRFWGEHDRALRAVALTATALIAAGASLAFSRGGAVGFALMLAIAAGMGYFSRSQVRLLLLGAVLIVALMPQYLTRLASLGDLLPGHAPAAGERPDGAVLGRATEMLGAIYAYLDYPLLGVGPGMFKFHSKEYGDDIGLRQLEGNRQAHCLYLDIAAETGTLGLACFLAMIGLTWRNLARASRALRRPASDTAAMANGLLLALITYLTTGIFLHASYIRYFWLLMAVAGSAYYVAGQSALQLDLAAGRLKKESAHVIVENRFSENEP